MEAIQSNTKDTDRTSPGVAGSVSRPRYFLFVLLLGLLGFGLAACLLEVSVRLFFPTTDFLWQWDSRIGLKLIPGMHGRSVKPGIFDVKVDVNSAGFRDREHSIIKPSGTKRVVLLGDSFVEAIQVPFENSITAQLENRLGSTGKTEVINFGVSGTGTARQYLALREYALQYKPDVVLLFFVGNDISDNSRRLQGRSYVPYPETVAGGSLARDENGQPVFTPFADQTSAISPVADVLKNHWKSYRFVREMIDNSSAFNRLMSKLGLASASPDAVNLQAADNFGFYEIYRVEEKPVWMESWRATEELMVSVRDLAQAYGAKFGVVLIPAAWEVYPQLWEAVLTQTPAMRSARVDLEQPSKRLTSFLTEHGIVVMNLLPQFRDRAPGLPTLYVRNDAHWTSDGHRLAADLLTEPVSELLK